ncbi:MAG: dTDP-4-dehydrorhamnose reductase [Spirochaetales bacterium]|nr:dTDP-4-dehydrorhamnose reductase [Spirochaetales bacterium]
MVWIAGASGMLGQELTTVLSLKKIPFEETNSLVDIRETADVEQFAQGRSIDWVVNCAAYTAVDRAEDEPDVAWSLNAQGPSVLARWCRHNRAKMIHISTDYVFSGRADRPYLEDDPVDPQSVYGRTKAEGESAVRSELEHHFILRTAWLYGQHGPNFAATMLRLMREKPQIGVVDDQRGSPTWTRDLAGVISKLIQSQATEYGTYHVAGEGQTTWFGFAQEIYKRALEHHLLNTRPVLLPLTTAQYPTKAVRPAWSVLSKDKLRSTFGWVLPDWKESLEQYIRVLENQKNEEATDA